MSCGSRSQQPANGDLFKGLPTLTEVDFDLNNASLKKPGKAVVFFKMDWCGYCRNTKPEFQKFVEMGGKGFVVDAASNKNLMVKINENAKQWGFNVNGYPTIVGFNDG